MNPYTILQVSANATTDEIKHAYRRLALCHHPDHHPPHLQATKKADFCILKDAYDLLRDPKRRAKLNAARHFERQKKHEQSKYKFQQSKKRQHIYAAAADSATVDEIDLDIANICAAVTAATATATAAAAAAADLKRKQEQPENPS